MEGPRCPLETEYSEVLAFLKQKLRPDNQWSLASEYPTALSLSNIHNIRIITEDQKVLSHAVLKPLIIRSPLVVFKVGAIGSVVTESSHRNQGLSKKILEDCLEECHRQECDIAMLWTNLYEFYQKMNFDLAGTELSFVIEQDFPAPNANLKFMKTAQISAEAIARLYAQHTVSSVRTTEDIRKFLQIPKTTTYSAWDTSGQLVAYAVEGKGADLTGYIHEWGGSTSHLLSLLSYIRKERGHSFTIITPQHSTHLNEKLKSLPGVTTSQGFLGMIKIIQADQLFHKIKRAARSLGILHFVLEQRDGDVVFGIGGDLLVISDEKDLVKILFGPALPIPHIKSETQETLAKFLPLPLWVWGWDSV